MKKKILMINCYSKHWKYIPMGTFGICDFLDRHGVEVKIFNAAIYHKNEYLSQMECVCKSYKPDYVGLILHWKEVLENFIFLSRQIKSLFPWVKIVAGGLTAGFFHEEVLRREGSIDFTIKGDPEKPLCMLIGGDDVRTIPNLIYRVNGEVVSNEVTYVMDKETLNTISYTKLDYVIDWKRYIKKIDGILAFPVFIGRGCVYDCLYCGGSRQAFLAHSDRRRIVCRDVSCVIRDLKWLLNYTNNIYISYEVDVDYIANLFEAIIAEKALVKKFRLNYGAWHLMTPRMIDLYAKAFKFDEGQRSIIEISPETSLDEDRRIIKDKALFFSNKQMLRSIREIRQKLGDRVMIHVFYSRYHVTQKNREKLMLELENIHRFREHVYARGKNNIFIVYTQLSTDVGSFYWDAVLRDSGSSDAFDLLLCSIRKFERGEHMMQNLCIYAPQDLPDDVRENYDRLNGWIDLMLNKIPWYYFNITKVLGFSEFTMLLEEASHGIGSCKKNKVAVFIEILQKEIKDRYRGLYNQDPVFFDDLSVLSIKCVSRKSREAGQRQERLAGNSLLSQDNHYVSQYRFIDTPFYRSLRDGLAGIKKEKTLNVFGFDRIHSLEYKYYSFFELFCGGNSTFGIIRKIARQNDFSQEEVVRLCQIISCLNVAFRYRVIAAVVCRVGRIFPAVKKSCPLVTDEKQS